MGVAALHPLPPADQNSLVVQGDGGGWFEEPSITSRKRWQGLPRGRTTDRQTGQEREGWFQGASLLGLRQVDEVFTAGRQQLAWTAHGPNVVLFQNGSRFMQTVLKHLGRLQLCVVFRPLILPVQRECT